MALMNTSVGWAKERSDAPIMQRWKPAHQSMGPLRLAHPTGVRIYSLDLEGGSP